MNNFMRPIRLAFVATAAALTVGCATVSAPKEPFVPKVISLADGCATVTTREKAAPVVAVDQICIVTKLDDARQKYAADEATATVAAREEVVKALGTKGGVPGAMTAIGYYTNEGRVTDMPPELVDKLAKLQAIADAAKLQPASAPELPASQAASAVVPNRKHVATDKKAPAVVANDTPPQPKADKPTGTSVVKQIIAKAKDAAPGMAVGIATSTIAKTGLNAIALKFGIAAAATTMPGFLVAAGTVAAISAVAGGLAGVATHLYQNRGQQKSGKAIRKAFLKGAAYGAIGGAIGSTISSALNADGFVHTLFSHKPSVHVPAVDAAASAPAHASAPAATTAAPAPTVPVPTLSQTVQSLLSEEQMKALPKAVQKLAESQKPEDLVRFCKEASFNLINNTHNNPDALKAGAKLVERGLDIAKESHVHSVFTRMLNSDMKFISKAKAFSQFVTGLKPA